MRTCPLAGRPAPDRLQGPPVMDMELLREKHETQHETQVPARACPVSIERHTCDLAMA